MDDFLDYIVCSHVGMEKYKTKVVLKIFRQKLLYYGTLTASTFLST